MSFKDIFGSGTGRSFHFKDFRNAYRFRPDVNPGRQQFQGYVNFIFNRDLYESLYANDPSVAVKEFRTQISSMIRTADLPSVNFKTDTKNQYNRKKIVNLGVEYSPVNMTVLDTVGNEWLTTLMKYFSYHYMSPRNQSSNGRDIANNQLRVGGAENIGSEFMTGVFDSNKAGYNPNYTANFFERIDYVMYHGNKGVQYSIVNPVLTSFAPNAIDYASSEFREFQLSFEYESFTIHNVTNFGLSEEDLDRFEDIAEFSGPAFEQADLPDSMTERDLSILGQSNGGGKRNRSGQPVPGATIPTATGITSQETDEDGNPINTTSNTTATSPDATMIQRELDKRNSDLRDTYGTSATFANALSIDDGFGLDDLLTGVADNALSDIINTGKVSKAKVASGVLGGITQIISDTYNNGDGG